MTQTNADDYAALLLDYATGALTPAVSLVVETHVGMRADAARQLAAIETVGGALLEMTAPAAMTRGFDLHRKPAAAPSSLAEARQDVARARRRDPSLRWRRRPLGWRERPLTTPGAKLLWLTRGSAMPRHGHTGDEITLVLTGSFADESGTFGPGDIAFADDSLDHRPEVVGDVDCICLVALNGSYRFRTWMGRMAAWALQ